MLSAVRPKALVTRIPTSAATMVVAINIPTTEPPMRPRSATSRIFSTAATIITSTSGMMIMRNRLM